MKKLRVYVDSSVIGGMFDENEHPAQTRAFWNAVERGEVVIIASDILDEEMEGAPQCVRDFFDSLPESQIEHIVSTDESDDLAEQYVAVDIVKEKNLNDCRHIALATIAKADALVSWNCKHIVKPNRINRYNAINKQLGYSEMRILTPDRYHEVNRDQN